MEVTPTITLEVKQERFYRFLWIKYVTGFNPKVHCGKCLLGQYSKRIVYDRKSYYLPKIRLDQAPLDEHPAKFIYLCGVTPRWEWNLHIVGRAQPGSRVTHDDDRISVKLADFEPIAIDATQSPPVPKAFSTCRNWQFGWCGFPDTPREPDLQERIQWNE
jgi:hypothetical protein